MRESNEFFSLVRLTLMLLFGNGGIPSSRPRAGPEGHRSCVFLGRCTRLSNVRRGTHVWIVRVGDLRTIPATEMPYRKNYHQVSTSYD